MRPPLKAIMKTFPLIALGAVIHVVIQPKIMFSFIPAITPPPPVHPTRSVNRVRVLHIIADLDLINAGT